MKDNYEKEGLPVPDMPDSEDTLANVKFLITNFTSLQLGKFDDENLAGGMEEYSIVLGPALDDSHGGSEGSSHYVPSDNNQNIATTTKILSLFKEDGSRVTNRALGKNTVWVSDQILTHNNVKYFRVSTDEWVKANDVYVYQDSPTSVVRIATKGTLVNYLGETITDRKLKIGTEWKTDRIALINNKKYYRVSTNEFLAIEDGIAVK